MNEQLMEHLTVPGGTAQLTLHVLAREGPRISEGLLTGGDGRWWWIAAGVPRMLPSTMYRNRELEQRYAGELRRLGLRVDAESGGGGRLRRVQSRTIDRFGAEWLMFRDWGHHLNAPPGQEQEYQGGLWANTLSAFRTKTFLEGRLSDKLCLDAGCGNGRFTAAALAEGAREVIAVDIGWGVEAAYERFRHDPRVHVVQASLFGVPVRRVEAAFSIGVLMHTGDAARAFACIAERVQPGGVMAVRMYHRGNWAYEAVDGGIRAVTTRLSKPAQVRLSRGLARFGAWLAARDKARPGTRMRWYQVLRNWPTVHHNLDWWSAPVASHHTSGEVAAWGEAAGLRPLRAEPPPEQDRYGFWEWPEALTILFERPPVSEGCVAGTILPAPAGARGAVG